MVRRIAQLVFGVSLLAASATWGADEDFGYAWMTGDGDGRAYLVYGSPETGEDYVFILTCGDHARMTVYVDIEDTEVGDDVAIAFKGDAADLSVPGKIATDGMSGFHFAEATDATAKPVLAVLNGNGPVTVTTGSVVTALPAAGRDEAVSEFANSCGLD